VGTGIEFFGDTRQVLLLNDRYSVVGAMITNFRIQSPVGGLGEPLLSMKYVGNDDDVKVGERVVTSGMDRIFPKDLPVGIISQVKPGSPFKQIRIRPSANIERLEEVIVLLTTDPLTIKQDVPPPGNAAVTPPASSQPISGLTNTKPAEKHP
jgi:rod shape-determining protein MreC